MIPAAEIPAVVALHDAFGVTAREARALALLARGGVVTFDRIRDVYCRRPDADPWEVRHFRKRVRMKVPGMHIQNAYGIGYELGAESLAAVRAVLSKAEALA